MKLKITYDSYALKNISPDYYMKEQWYRVFKKQPSAAIRLFCFHHSGAGASVFFPWLSQLVKQHPKLTIGRQLTLPVRIASKKNHTISKPLPQKYSYYLAAS